MELQDPSSFVHFQEVRGIFVVEPVSTENGEVIAPAGINGPLHVLIISTVLSPEVYQ